ncbi:MAG: hypothetical protein H7A28_00745 [Thermotogae bacterium]|nr:hypothetical protein [Thermotogota bacterium]CCU83963.1 hypothetical protein PHOSAC3_120580 [Mesotoga infera]
MDRSEIFKTTEMKGRQRYIHSMLNVEALRTYFEFTQTTGNRLIIFANSITLSV